jgi:hypothetical protein
VKAGKWFHPCFVALKEVLAAACRSALARVSARRGLIFHKWQRAGERISLVRKIDISMDALSPTVIANLIREQIEAMIDMTKWRKREAAEQRNRALLDRVSQNWAKVKKAVG